MTASGAVEEQSEFEVAERRYLLCTQESPHQIQKPNGEIILDLPHTESLDYLHRSQNRGVNREQGKVESTKNGVFEKQSGIEIAKRRDLYFIQESPHRIQKPNGTIDLHRHRQRGKSGFADQGDPDQGYIGKATRGSSPQLLRLKRYSKWREAGEETQEGSRTTATTAACFKPDHLRANREREEAACFEPVYVDRRANRERGEAPCLQHTSKVAVARPRSIELTLQLGDDCTEQRRP